MAYRLASLLLAVLLILPAGLARADVVSPDASYYVLDEAEVLQESTKRDIIQSNEALERAYGTRIVVVTVHSTYPMDILGYAEVLYDAWAIGAPPLDNGVLLLLAIDDEDYALLMGYDLEHLFPTEMQDALLDQALEPYFAAGEYDAGVQTIFSLLLEGISLYYTQDFFPAPTPEPIYLARVCRLNA